MLMILTESGAVECSSLLQQNEELMMKQWQEKSSIIFFYLLTWVWTPPRSPADLLSPCTEWLSQVEQLREKIIWTNECSSAVTRAVLARWGCWSGGGGRGWLRSAEFLAASRVVRSPGHRCSHSTTGRLILGWSHSGRISGSCWSWRLGHRLGNIVNTVVVRSCMLGTPLRFWLLRSFVCLK